MAIASKVFATILRSEALLHEMSEKAKLLNEQKLPKKYANVAYNLSRDIEALAGDIAYLKELVQSCAK